MTTKQLRNKILDLAIHGRLVKKEGEWEEKTLGEVCTFESGLAYSSDKYVSQGSPLIRISNIVDGSISLTNCAYINESDYPRHFYVDNGDLLIAMSGATTGKMGIYHSENRAVLNQRVGNIKIKDHTKLCAGFRNLLMESLKPIIEEIAYGGAQPNISSKMICALPIPLPPLAEQERIVAAVEKWMSLIDVIESGQENLQQSIALAKNKILDLAIKGKLVENEGEWEEKTLGEVCDFLSRGKSPKYSETDRSYPVFAQKCNLKDGGISLDQARFLEPSTISKWPDVYHLRTGDVLVNSTGTGTVGRTRLFDEKYLGNFPFVVPDSHVSVVRTKANVDSSFIFYVLTSRDGQQYLEENLAGSTNQKELYIGVLKDMIIPLPPLTEQRRIVAKVEELFAQLDSIADALR